MHTGTPVYVVYFVCIARYMLSALAAELLIQPSNYSVVILKGKKVHK
jgi:hypothetical protein